MLVVFLDLLPCPYLMVVFLDPCPFVYHYLDAGGVLWSTTLSLSGGVLTLPMLVVFLRSTTLPYVYHYLDAGGVLGSATLPFCLSLPWCWWGVLRSATLPFVYYYLDAGGVLRWLHYPAFWRWWCSHLSLPWRYLVVFDPLPCPYLDTGGVLGSTTLSHVNHLNEPFLRDVGRVRRHHSFSFANYSLVGPSVQVHRILEGCWKH